MLRCEAGARSALATTCPDGTRGRGRPSRGGPTVSVRIRAIDVATTTLPPDPCQTEGAQLVQELLRDALAQ